MSSETSIEPRRDEALQPWQLFTLAGLIGATVVVFLSRGETPSGIVLLSLIIFTAAIVGIGAWRTLAPFTGRDEPTGPQILGGRTRAALEREKALVLRSIKELEFDKAMGKMSDKDFAEMSARLRSRAAGLIRQLDAGAGYRDQIEQEIQKRVKRGGPQGAPLRTQEAAGPDLTPAAVGPALTARHVCSECQVENDPDARFCKNCGARMEAQA
jgi:hypothetical protein